jgi:hypothetical protein
MKALRKLVLITLAVTLLTACGASAATVTPGPTVSPTPFPSLAYFDCMDMVASAMDARKGELYLWSLLEDRETLFADYDGGEKQVISPDYSTETDLFVGGTFTASAYFWRDDSGAATPEEAAAALVGQMMEDIKAMPEKCRSFTLLDYFVPAQRLYTWDDLVRANTEVVWWGVKPGLSYEENLTYINDAVNSIFPVLYENRQVSASEEYIQLALPEDMWTFTPNVNYSFKGFCNMLWDTDDLSAYQVAENLYCTGFDYGPPGIMILAREGSVWRMQTWNYGMTLMFDRPLLPGGE